MLELNVCRMDTVTSTTYVLRMDQQTQTTSVIYVTQRSQNMNGLIMKVQNKIKNSIEHFCIISNLWYG